MMNLIEIKNVSKKFNENIVVNNVSLSIKKGSIVGIIGRNGSGKTVLLKMISSLYYPTEGEIILNNVNIQNDLGILIDTGFMNNISGYENLKILSNLNNKTNDSDIIEIMKLVTLEPFSKKKYKDYSTGMKQKLKIAQAIMDKPKVLILDEPFNGLDKESVKYFRELFLNMNKEGTTIIITSHYKEDIDILCKEVYEMDNGIINKINI